MSNKASDNLHRLIRSMSKPEKRYFKVFSSRHIIGEENNYLVLFDAIDRQEEYDEEKLLKKFRDKGFARRFSIAKNRLYNAILRSLDAFHSNSSTEAQLHRQVHAAEILYHKSLYDQSLKLLESARKTAKKHEMLTILAEIGAWEKRILEKSQYEEIGKSSEIERILEEDRALTDAMALLNELWNIKSTMFFSLYRQGKARTAEERTALKAIIDNAALRVDEKKTGVRGVYLLHHIYSAYHFACGEYAECYPYLQRNLKLIRKHPDIFSEEPSTYLSVLTNSIYVGMRLGEWDQAFLLLEQLRSYAERPEVARHEDEQLRLFGLVKSTELTLYAQRGDFDKGREIVAGLEEGLARFGDELSSVRRAHLFFNAAVIEFGAEHYHDSLRWINRLLNDVDIDKTKDIHCMGQLMNLVIHLELGNEQLLPYALRSTQRFLETRKKVYRFENVLLEFVNDMLRKRQDKSKTARYAELASRLEELKEDAFERTAFEFFDFLAWARSKVNGIRYREQLAA